MSDPDWRVWAMEVREAGPRCPDVETLRRFVEREASGDFPIDPEARWLGEHLERCPCCRLEADEVWAFFSDRPASASVSRDHDGDRLGELLRPVLSSPGKIKKGERQGAGVRSRPARGSFAVRVHRLLTLPARLMAGARSVLSLSGWRHPDAPSTPE